MIRGLWTFSSCQVRQYHLSGYIKKQNFRYWSDNNPMQPLHSAKDWPYLFTENNLAITVASEHYCTILQTFLATELQRMRQQVRNVWF